MVKRMLQGTIKLGEPTGLSSVSKCLSKWKEITCFLLPNDGVPNSLHESGSTPLSLSEVGHTPVPGSLTV